MSHQIALILDLDLSAERCKSRIVGQTRPTFRATREATPVHQDRHFHLDARAPHALAEVTWGDMHSRSAHAQISRNLTLGAETLSLQATKTVAPARFVT